MSQTKTAEQEIWEKACWASAQTGLWITINTTSSTRNGKQIPGHYGVDIRHHGNLVSGYSGGDFSSVWEYLNGIASGVQAARYVAAREAETDAFFRDAEKATEAAK